jgi:hypothetical protein
MRAYLHTICRGQGVVGGGGGGGHGMAAVRRGPCQKGFQDLPVASLFTHPLFTHPSHP